MSLKKSDIWHLKEGVARDLGKIYHRIDAYLTNRDKRDEQVMLMIHNLKDEIKAIKSKKK